MGKEGIKELKERPGSRPVYHQLEHRVFRNLITCHLQTKAT